MPSEGNPAGQFNPGLHREQGKQALVSKMPKEKCFLETVFALSLLLLFF